jgi:hypothetical protein
MFIKRQTALFALLILLAILACSSPIRNGGAPTQPAVSTRSQQNQFIPGIVGGNSGAASKWPGYIPADIPPLEGQIRLVMEAPGSHVRIFYEALSRSQLDQYLKLVEGKGFHLEYIAYVQEGFPDNSKERLQRGDFDAVDMTKAPYHMRLEYGADAATYDIYESGFQIPAGGTNTYP